LNSTLAAAWPADLPRLFATDPDPEKVIATLDSEMSRLEQAITRSGWTSWAGTAGLGGIAWVFVTLLDDAPAFPWHNFLVITALLSFVQDFCYGVDLALRPQRGLGLLVGGQARVMLSKDTLPFARKEYSFYLVRGSLLATASYLFLPDLVGWPWWFPFITYTLVCVTMIINLVLSSIDRPIPKHIKFDLGHLVGQALSLALALMALNVLAKSWQDTDFVALKAALLVTAAAHVLRGLAQPRFELPALDKLRELRRKLGFGQITALEAVAQAEAALFGVPSLLVLSQEVMAFIRALERCQAEVTQLSQRIETLGNHIQAVGGRQDVKGDDIRVGEALFRDALATQRAVVPLATRFSEAEHALVERLEHYKQGTRNDPSIPIMERLLATQKQGFGRVSLTVMRRSGLLVTRARALEQLAEKHGLAISPEVKAAVNALDGHLSRQVARVQQTIRDRDVEKPA